MKSSTLSLFMLMEGRNTLCIIPTIPSFNLNHRIISSSSLHPQIRKRIRPHPQFSSILIPTTSFIHIHSLPNKRIQNCPLVPSHGHPTFITSIRILPLQNSHSVQSRLTLITLPTDRRFDRPILFHSTLFYSLTIFPLPYPLLKESSLSPFQPSSTPFTLIETASIQTSTPKHITTTKIPPPLPIPHFILVQQR